MAPHDPPKRRTGGVGVDAEFVHQVVARGLHRAGEAAGRLEAEAQGYVLSHRSIE